MKSERAATMAQYLEILSDDAITADEVQEPHASHLRLARQFLADAADAWWTENEDGGFGHVAAALKQTWQLAGCTDSCGASPRNRIR